MVFSSVVFLFCFLPAVLLGYFLLPSLRLRNWFLFFVSLFFYAWGEGRFVLVLSASIVFNYFIALALNKNRHHRRSKLLIAIAIILNVSLLVIYKYANFLCANLSTVLVGLGLPAIVIGLVHLPIGISFFTFHELSYLIDIYRGQAKAQKSLINTALYVTFFPQLIAGPIIRYHQIASQFSHRFVTRQDFAAGVRRFIIGLGKKLIIANAVAAPVEKIFAISAQNVTWRLAWFGALCYMLQIYFDFSGYSDMAIGLAHMFGFRFPENFNYPYVSRSITEFWRRWHMSLSFWFRDYVYIPLGGNRVSPSRTYINLLIVFFLCGLWHGASWTFVLWGLYHGFFLVLERLGFSKTLERLWPPVRHLYAILVIACGWVLFRANSLTQALGFLKAMAGMAARSNQEYHAGLYLNAEVKILILAGILGSAPVIPWLRALYESWARHASKLCRQMADAGLSLGSVAAFVAIMAASVLRLASGTYNPFIYFRF